MPTTNHECPLPLVDTICPSTEEELIAVLKAAGPKKQPVYPLGAGTGLQMGLPVTREGIGLSLAAMDRVVEYPARDMTITVEAGMNFDQLQNTLRAEGQWLPLDPPCASRAQVGGIVATNAGGPRRFGYGTPREFVIGIRAIDGRGVPFQAGGRVVKNVAGYDFCRLLSGSRGTLAIITQVTWKLRPRPRSCAILMVRIDDGKRAENWLDRLNTSRTTPVAVQLEAGSSEAIGGGIFGIAYEGTSVEVDWQIDQMGAELREAGLTVETVLRDAETQETWSRWQEFAVSGDAVVRFRAHVLPHSTVQMLRSIQELLPTAQILAQAGSGIVDVRLPNYPSDGLTQTFTKNLTPLAMRLGGHLTLTYHATGQELTHEMMWGGATVPWQLMRSLQRQFDPNGILNPQRFISS
ncbi:MAG: FAD-binding oxidoreductase [Planctomycetota bacterium]|nr:FAD-binding oxidoreductase [Planctomycetota bacterium]